MEPKPPKVPEDLDAWVDSEDAKVNRYKTGVFAMRDCPQCARLMTWADTAYIRGYKVGEGQSLLHFQQASEALVKEREERREDNVRFTDMISGLEAKIEALENEMRVQNETG